MLAYGADIGLYLALLSLLATAASLLSQKKPKLAPLDDALQSVATQGAFVPVVIGRERLGPIFAFVEDATGGAAALVPQARNNLAGNAPLGTQSSFAKGGGGVPSAGSYRENALHVICVGPASKLHKIWQNGEVIWEGPIDPVSTPSGTLLQAGNNGSEGYFEIHWGFPDDPILTRLQNSKYHGLAVRYSHVLKIFWNFKELGPTRQWPRLEYEVTCPCYSQIATTPSEIPQVGDDARPIWSDWTSANAFNPPQPPGFLASNKVQFTAWVVNAANREIAVWDQRTIINGQPDLSAFFPPGGIIKIRTTAPWSASLPPQGGYTDTFNQLLPNDVWKYYRIIRSYRSLLANPGSPAPAQVTVTSVILGPEASETSYENEFSGPLRTLSSAITQAWIEPLDTANRDGINPIHMIDQLLFARYPYGAGKNREKFDPRSIEHAAQVLHDERIRGSLVIKDGESLRSVLSEIMQDIGLFIVWDVKVGRYVFNAIRYEESATNLPAEMILESPEAIGVMGSRPSDVTAFTFKDRQRNYREVPVKVFDSGQVAEYQSQRAKKISIGVTKDRDSVTRLVPRRQQEVMANLEALRFVCNHGAVLATSGQRFTANEVEEFGMQFLIWEVQRYIDSSKVEIYAPIDCYNPPSYTPTSGIAKALRLAPANRSDSNLPVLQLQAFRAFEMPRALSDGRVQILVLGARSGEQTQAGQVWCSQDGVTFAVVGAAPIVISGVLYEGLSADLAYDEGDHFVDFETNVDVNTIDDLSLTPDLWRAGKQIMVIGEEVIFLREAVAASGGDSIIRGLIRGRAGTRIQSYPEGTRFFILQAAQVVPIESSLFAPGRELTFKAQAVTKSRVSDLESIVGQTLEVQALGYKPLQITALRQSSLKSTYSIGASNINLTWCYYSDEFKRTGLGTQLFGAPSGQSPPRGYFLVTLPDGKSLETTTNSVSIPLSLRAVLDTLPSWDVQVTHVEGSFSSDPETLTLVPV